MSPRPKTFSDAELLTAIKNTKQPFATVSGLSEELGVTSTAISKRLKKLEGEQIESKKVGAKARVWWIPN